VSADDSATRHPPGLTFPAVGAIAMQSLLQLATDFTAMLRLGQFAAAGEKYWADAVTSTEPMDLPGGISARVSGLEAVRAKSKIWLGANRIDDLSIDGPFVTGNQFALFMDMMIVGRADEEARPFTEIALYTVRDGRITEERYFYD